MEIWKHCTGKFCSCHGATVEHNASPSIAYTEQQQIDFLSTLCQEVDKSAIMELWTLEDAANSGTGDFLFVCSLKKNNSLVQVQDTKYFVNSF